MEGATLGFFIANPLIAVLMIAVLLLTGTVALASVLNNFFNIWILIYSILIVTLFNKGIYKSSMIFALVGVVLFAGINYYIALQGLTATVNSSGLCFIPFLCQTAIAVGSAFNFGAFILDAIVKFPAILIELFFFAFIFKTIRKQVR